MRKCSGYKITKEGFGRSSRMRGSFQKLYTLSVRESEWKRKYYTDRCSQFNGRN